MSQSSKLYRLQQIDTQQDEIQVRLEELETLLNNHLALMESEETVKNAETHLREDQKELGQAEIHVKDQRIKIEQSEATLYSGKVHNPKELQDLQNDISSLKKYLVVLEDRQLEAMFAVEEAEALAAQTHIEHQNVQAQTIEQQAHLVAERNLLQQKRGRLDIERQAASSGLTPEELDLYLLLRKQRRGIAVSRVIDKTCSACGALLTPAVIQTASSPTQMVRCATCGRILFPG